MDFIKIKRFSSKALSENVKKQAKIGIKYSKHAYLPEDSYLEYVKNSISNRKTSQLRSKRVEQTLPRGKHTKGQSVYRKALNLTYQRNVN